MEEQQSSLLSQQDYYQKLISSHEDWELARRKKMNVITEQIKAAIAQNSMVAQDQDEYEKRYRELYLGT